MREASLNVPAALTGYLVYGTENSGADPLDGPVGRIFYRQEITNCDGAIGRFRSEFRWQNEKCKAYGQNAANGKTIAYRFSGERDHQNKFNFNCTYRSETDRITTTSVLYSIAKCQGYESAHCTNHIPRPGHHVPLLQLFTRNHCKKDNTKNYIRIELNLLSIIQTDNQDADNATIIPSDNR